MHSSNHFVDLRSLLFARVSLTPRQVQIINDNIDDHDHEFTLELSGGLAMLITKTMIVSLREYNIDHWDTTELITVNSDNCSQTYSTRDHSGEGRFDF